MSEHVLKFYPVGNGDTSQIILKNGKRILIYFYHSSKSENDQHPEINLATTLKGELKEDNCDFFDVVIFTHGDRDHTEGSSEFFEFDHADKYKGNGRIKIKMLYVPAAMILESRNDVTEDYRVIQAEARYRLKEGYGILVFSRPEKLESRLVKEGLTAKDIRKNCIDAGKIIPHFNLESDGVEFFVHAPYKKHVDENPTTERNESAIILHATFKIGKKETRLFMIGDTEHHVLEDIVEITEAGSHKHERRLEWDIYNIPHHCSYLALNKNGEKGEKETTPTDKVKQLLNYGNNGSLLISSSYPIGCDYTQIQPPHIQAFNCYTKINTENSGRGITVTMSYPTDDNPETVEIVINDLGFNFSDYCPQEDYIENHHRVIIKNYLKIDCDITQNGYRTELLRKIKYLRTNKKLRFFIESTDVPKPYAVKWKVRNRGSIARKKNMLRGEISIDKGNQEKIEQSNFKGAHYVECYIIKDNVCVARDIIHVPIEITPHS